MKITTNKKINRIDRLSDYRKLNSLTTRDSIGTFEVEISPKALDYLKNSEHKVYFSLEHDFTPSKYWLRVDKDCPNIRTDFTYLATGHIESRQHSGMDKWGVQVIFNHIDISCKWGQLQTVCKMLAKYIDDKYGEDCGFVDYINNKEIDYINNKL